jgi:hypothetical protein
MHGFLRLKARGSVWKEKLWILYSLPSFAKILSHSFLN